MSNSTRRLKSVERALAVIAALADADAPLGVTDLARLTGIPKSSVHLCLQTLRDGGFIERQAESPRYQLGLRLAQIGLAAVERSQIRTSLAPTMKALADRSGEAVSLAVAADRWALIVERFESAHVLRATIRVGTKMPMHASASGKCLLSGMSPEEVDRLIPGAPPTVTDSTFDGKARLLRELRQVRRRGFATNRDEFTGGVSAVAVPLFSNGAVVAALSVAGPTQRFNPAEYVDELLRISRGTNVAKGMSERAVLLADHAEGTGA